jgi:hypothetical protein
MKLHVYSSLAAFSAHYAALRTARPEASGAANANAPSADDAATLTEMDRLVDDFSPADRDALRDNAASLASATLSGAAARHRARAELKLRHLLAGRGILAG